MAALSELFEDDGVSKRAFLSLRKAIDLVRGKPRDIASALEMSRELKRGNHEH